MFFECVKLNPSNKNYLVETIGLKLLYVIYGFTTLVIANLICLANIPISDVTIYYLEQSLTVSCFCRCLLVLPKENYPFKETVGSVAYSSYNSLSFFKYL